MKTLLAIAALLLISPTANAQNVFLWVRNVSTLQTKLEAVNTALGYPNPPSLTYRAIDYMMMTNGTNAIVRLDVDLVWSPRYNRYIDLVAQIKNQLTEAQWGVDICTNLTQLVGRPVARISRSLAKEIGVSWLNDTP